VNADELANGVNFAAYHFRNGYWRRWTRTRTLATPTGRVAATTSTSRSAATLYPRSRAAPRSSATATSCARSATTSPHSWATPSSYVYLLLLPLFPASSIISHRCLLVLALYSTRCVCVYISIIVRAGDPSRHGSGRRAALPVLPGGQRHLVVPWHR
jgi:hypothetical protein